MGSDSKVSIQSFSLILYHLENANNYTDLENYSKSWASYSPERGIRLR